MLETLDNQNVKRMEIESPEKDEGLLFDPEKDVTEDDWTHILETLKEADLHDDMSVPALLQNIKFLFPEKIAALKGYTGNIHTDIGIHADILEKDILEVYPLMRNIIGLKIIRPDDEDLKRINPGLLTDALRTEAGVLGGFINIHWGAKTLYPDKYQEIANEFLPTEERWQEMGRELRIMLENDNEDEFYNGVHAAGLLKILFPAEFAKFNVLSDKVWKKMRQILSDSRINRRWEEFSEIARNMKILFAKEIIINDDEWNVIMPEPEKEFVEKESAMPVQRKF